MTSFAGTRLVRVLVVDDSAFARKIVREMLTGDPLIEVIATARDGQEALTLVEELKPDVVTCDLTMPRLDGPAFVRAQMARRPLPIVILSSAAEDTEEVLESLAAGAIDVLRKPTALATHDLLRIREDLIGKVRAAAQAPAHNLMQSMGAPAPLPSRAHTTTSATKLDVVCIGISTGGPQALRKFIPQFPKDFPVPIAMVLHMPIGYTAMFAQKLDEISELTVREAEAGDLLRPGVALLAPAGKHLKFCRDAAGDVRAELSMAPLDKIHRPSVDVLFRSAAEVFHDRVLGVVMTGMGDDGKEGAAWIKAQGGTVLTEAESSCVIYGMPRSVVEAGLSDAAVSLSEMTETICKYV